MSSGVSTGHRAACRDHSVSSGCRESGALSPGSGHRPGDPGRVSAEPETEASRDTPTDPRPLVPRQPTQAEHPPPLNLTQSAAGVARQPAVRTRLRDQRPGSGPAGRGGWRPGPGDQGSWASGGMEAPASWALLWPWVGGWWPHPPSLSPLLFCTGGRVGLASLAHVVHLLRDIRCKMLRGNPAPASVPRPRHTTAGAGVLCTPRRPPPSVGRVAASSVRPLHSRPA